MKTNAVCISALVLLLLSCAVPTAAALQTISRNPYGGAIAVDAATGKVLFADNADAKGYPASVTKLMVLLVILEAIESRRLTLDEQVTVTAESAKIGGSQVYLKENEVISVEDLLYALIIQSANDAATALAIHYAGSKQAFVDLMNQRAREIGMKDTSFHSVHGLPPGKGQLPDVSTPRDIAMLCRELLKNPDVLKYTSARERSFRQTEAKPFVLRSHNRLLRNMEGCDGFKTGYFRAAGYSIAATATKNNQRVIAVVIGSVDRKVRDARAREILRKGLLEIESNPPLQAPQPPKASSKPAPDIIQVKKSTMMTVGAGIAGMAILGFGMVALRNRARGRKSRRTPRYRV